ncbi:MAG TPA: hypothetical protein VNL97_00240 [Solirubrobacterales bacterium]|nr:hypothetical protein [Solirubrobacterales bacterium]
MGRVAPTIMLAGRRPGEQRGADADDRPAGGQRGPKTYRLKPCRHRIEVRAVLDGLRDPTPARVTINVLRKAP